MQNEIKGIVGPVAYLKGCHFEVRQISNGSLGWKKSPLLFFSSFSLSIKETDHVFDVLFG
jgi:hypothetical protein